MRLRQLFKQARQEEALYWNSIQFHLKMIYAIDSKLRRMKKNENKIK